MVQQILVDSPQGGRWRSPIQMTHHILKGWFTGREQVAELAVMDAVPIKGA